MFSSLSSSPLPIGDSSYGSQPSSHRGDRTSFRQVPSQVISEPPPEHSASSYVGQVGPSDVAAHYAISRQASDPLPSASQQYGIQRATGFNAGTSSRFSGPSEPASYSISQQRLEGASDRGRTMSSTSTSARFSSAFRTPLDAAHDDTFSPIFFHPSSTRTTASVEQS